MEDFFLNMLKLFGWFLLFMFTAGFTGIGFRPSYQVKADMLYAIKPTCIVFVIWILIVCVFTIKQYHKLSKDNVIKTLYDLFDIYGWTCFQTLIFTFLSFISYRQETSDILGAIV